MRYQLVNAAVCGDRSPSSPQRHAVRRQAVHVKFYEITASTRGENVRISVHHSAAGTLQIASDNLADIQMV
jgi:hypothetical protein